MKFTEGVARRILFVAASGPGYGNGHRVRTGKVAACLTGAWAEGRGAGASGSKQEGPRVRMEDWVDEETLCRQVAEFQPDLTWLDKRESPPGLLRKLQKLGTRIILLDSIGDERALADYVVESIPGLETQAGRANLMGVAWLPGLTAIPSDVEGEKRGAILYAGGIMQRDLLLSWCREALRSLSKLGAPAGILTRLSFWLPGFVEDDIDLHTAIRGFAQIHFGVDGAPELFFQGVKTQSAEAFQSELTRSGLFIGYYGLSAFEALSSGAPVLLLSPYEVHHALSEKQLPDVHLGMAERAGRPLRWEDVVKGSERLRPAFRIGAQFHRWPRLLDALCECRRPQSCPACGNPRIAIAHRRRQANLWHCPACRLFFLDALVPAALWQDELADHARSVYGEAYFVDEYRRAYGKTYEEDRAHIHALSDARLAYLKRVAAAGRLLDVGAAMGFFLDRAREAGFETHGVEASAWAAAKANPVHRMRAGDFMAMETEGPFEVVTLWYVVEHLADFRKLFGKIASIQRKGGILALGTPNGLGLSARWDRARFLDTSPDDHFYIYGAPNLERMLAPFGYRLVGVKSTGIHVSRFQKRFPGISKWVPAGLWARVAARWNLGDTAEFYFRKS